MRKKNKNRERNKERERNKKRVKEKKSLNDKERHFKKHQQRLNTAVFFHRYVKNRRTDTFSMVSGGPAHVESIATKCKIFPGAPFF